MTGSYLLRGKSDSLNGFSEASPNKLPESRHEEGPRGGDSGEKKLCDNYGHTCGRVIWSKDIFLAKSARNLGESRL